MTTAIRKLRIKKTNRGFALGEFVDRYGAKCSIQKSSLATEDCIWLGVDEVEPQIMARDAMALGRSDLLNPPSDPERHNGWVKYPIPEEVSLNARMHLTREMVAELLPQLQNFVKTGYLKAPSKPRRKK